jgi:hypothetical protein
LIEPNWDGEGPCADATAEPDFRLLPRSAKYRFSRIAEISKGDFSIQARLLPVEHLSFPQFDVRNAKTADV